MAVQDCIQNPDCSVLIIGPTIKQTVDIVHQSMKKICIDDPGLVKRSKSESRWYIGKSELIVGGFDMVNATRQRGKTLHGIYVEEVVDSDPDDYIEAIRSDLGPALTHSKSGRIIYLSTLPKIPDHPFITETIPEARLHGAFFKYTIDDNKQLTADQYEACVRRCGGKDTIEYQREYLCEIVRDPSVVVVPHFEESRHVKFFTRPIHAYYQVTVDWGGVQDLTVALFHYYVFELNKMFVEREVVWPAHTPTSEILGELRAIEGRDPIHARYVDAPGQLGVDLHQMGYECILLGKEKQNWQANVNAMSVMFATDSIEISKECPFLIQSLRSGTFNKQKNDFERTQALGHCDALAALMYAVKVQDRTNPYPHHFVPGGMIYNREADPLEDVASNVRVFQDQPVKKFGRFR